MNENVVSSPDPRLWTIVLIGILILALICPFITNEHRRRLCYRRLIGRNGTGGDDEHDGIVLPTRFIRTYPIGDPRYRLTPEKAEEETNKFILDKLSPYSKVIDGNDFVSTLDTHSSTLSTNYEDEVGEEETVATTHSTSTEEMFEDDLIVQRSNHATSGARTSSKSSYTAEEIVVVENEQSQATEEEPDPEMNSDDKVMLKLPSPGVSINEYQQKENAMLLKQQSSNQDIELNGKNNSRMNEHDVAESSNSSCLVSYRTNECSICLGSFSIGDTVSWSALDHCDHVFHKECISDWLIVQGRKSFDGSSSSSTRRSPTRNENNNIMQAHLCRYSMKCPNCRRDFIPKNEK